jgi:hypothetical protein
MTAIRDALADWLTMAATRAGEPLDDARAAAIAHVILADYGAARPDTTASDVMAPLAPSPEEMPRGPRERGWRVQGQAQRLRTAQLFLGPRRRAADERHAREAKERTAKRTLARRAKNALAAHPDAPERQRQAYQLVRVDGLTLNEAAQRLGIRARQTVHELVARFEARGRST